MDFALDNFELVSVTLEDSTLTEEYKSDALTIDKVIYFLRHFASYEKRLQQVTQYFENSEQLVSKAQQYNQTRNGEINSICERLKSIQNSLESLCLPTNCLVLDEIKIYEKALIRYNSEIITVGPTQIDQTAVLEKLCNNEKTGCTHLLVIFQECLRIVTQQEMPDNKQNIIPEIHKCIQMLESFFQLLNSASISFKNRKETMQKQLDMDYDLICESFDLGILIRKKLTQLNENRLPTEKFLDQK